MARFGMFGLGRQDPRDEKQTSWTRWGRVAGLGAVAGAAVLAAGLLGLSGAHASNATLTAMPNPVHVSGGQTSGTTVLSWDTGTGMSGTVYVDHGSGKSVFATGITGETTAQVLCNKTNEFTLEDSASSAVLATLSVGVTGCAAPSPSPTPKPSPSPSSSPKPLPADLVLTPNSTWHSTNNYYDENDSWYCGLYTNGLGDWAGNVQFPETAVGYFHYDDPGTQPLPCWSWTDGYDRGAVQFDWNKVNSYVQAHGFTSATLSYSSDLSAGDSVGCVASIGENSDDLSTANPFPAPIPGGGLPLTPSVSGNNAKVDVGGALLLGTIFGGVSPTMHFVFTGKDESLSEQDNNHCDAFLNNFKLTIAPDH